MHPRKLRLVLLARRDRKSQEEPVDRSPTDDRAELEVLWRTWQPVEVILCAEQRRSVEIGADADSIGGHDDLHARRRQVAARSGVGNGALLAVERVVELHERPPGFGVDRPARDGALAALQAGGLGGSTRQQEEQGEDAPSACHEPDEEQRSPQHAQQPGLLRKGPSGAVRHHERHGHRCGAGEKHGERDHALVGSVVTHRFRGDE